MPLKPLDATSPTYHTAARAYALTLTLDGVPLQAHRFGLDGPLPASQIAHAGRLVRQTRWDHPGRDVQLTVVQER